MLRHIELLNHSPDSYNRRDGSGEGGGFSVSVALQILPLKSKGSYIKSGPETGQNSATADIKTL